MDYTKPENNAPLDPQKKSQRESRDITPMENVTAEVKKKTAAQKLLSSFIKSDAVNVKDYIIFDVLLPTVRDTFFDIVTNSLAMTLGVDIPTRRNSSRSSKDNSRVRYDEAYRRSYQDTERRQRREREDFIDFGEVLLKDSDDRKVTKRDAEEVVLQLMGIVDRYGDCSIADLYQKVGIKPEWTDYDYGWKDVSSASTYPVDEGYMIRMPRPRLLDGGR